MEHSLVTDTAIDRVLVTQHLAGDSAAFRRLVERHQGAVCAVAYSICGDLTRSEDIAQETFVAAWRQLERLEDPGKLRAWLCGIARNLARNAMRQAERTPTARAEAISDGAPTEIADPSDQAVRADEADLMWRALAGIPEIYREPMVLFYREDRSVEAVAEALEITEENARQRLARGRALLTQRMEKLVEESLERSAPTPAFAGAVMSLLPIVTGPLVTESTLGAGEAAVRVAAGGAAAAGAVLTKGGMAMKALGLVGFLPMVLMGALDFLRFRASYEGERSATGKRQVVATHLAPQLLMAAAVLGFGGLHFLKRMDWFQAWFGMRGYMWLMLAWLVALLVLAAALRRWRKRAEIAVGHDSTGASPMLSAAETNGAYEYRSRASWLGLPLVHVRVGACDGAMRRVARGWIAVSDGIAVGGLFGAGGQVAVAPISVGPCAVGVLGFGLVSCALWAVGGLAAGLYASGGVAAGWVAAQGGIWGGATDWAVGRAADAAHANDVAARAFFDGHFFFRSAASFSEVFLSTLFYLWVVSLVLMLWYLWRGQRADARIG
jgi:RNA polymerase sigma factor (sigma-70 family)